MPKNILTVTAHPDDEILGFGASAWALSQQGHQVHHLILSGNVEARRNRPEIEELHQDISTANALIGSTFELGDFPNIQFNTVPHIELVQRIEKTIEAFTPDYIFTHFPNDLNDDHKQVSQACQAAFRLFQRKPLPRISGLFLMEIASSTDWSFGVRGELFQPNVFLPIGEEGLQKKLEALACYRGVMRPYPHPRSEEVIRGTAALRGGQSGYEYAEAFQSVYLTGLFDL